MLQVLQYLVGTSIAAVEECADLIMVQSFVGGARVFIHFCRWHRVKVSRENLVELAGNKQMNLQELTPGSETEA
jgi:hypothetical protein